MRQRYEEEASKAAGGPKQGSVLRGVVMYEVFFAIVGALSGFAAGGAELGAVCLFLGSVLGMFVGLLQR